MLSFVLQAQCALQACLEKYRNEQRDHELVCIGREAMTGGNTSLATMEDAVDTPQTGLASYVRVVCSWWRAS